MNADQRESIRAIDLANYQEVLNDPNDERRLAFETRRSPVSGRGQHLSDSIVNAAQRVRDALNHRPAPPNERSTSFAIRPATFSPANVAVVDLTEEFDANLNLSRETRETSNLVQAFVNITAPHRAEEVRRFEAEHPEACIICWAVAQKERSNHRPVSCRNRHRIGLSAPPGYQNCPPPERYHPAQRGVHRGGFARRGGHRDLGARGDGQRDLGVLGGQRGLARGGGQRGLARGGGQRGRARGGRIEKIVVKTIYFK